MKQDELMSRTICAAINVHRELGPGLLESVYETCLAAELKSKSLNFKRQAPVDLVYRGEKIESGLRLDMLVEDDVIVELKSVESLLPIHKAQLLSYLKLSNKKCGLLINFCGTLERWSNQASQLISVSSVNSVVIKNAY